MLNTLYTKAPISEVEAPKVLRRAQDSVNRRRIGLDIMRSTAILMVILYHSFPILDHIEASSSLASPIKKMRVFSDWFGPLGVDLFFVLSGFLIGAILINTFLKSEQYNMSQVFNFWIRRWFRTIPNYFFILTIAFALYHYKYALQFDWHYYIFSQNLFSPHPKFFGEAWSLAVEEWFYLTLPVFLLLVSRFAKKVPKQKIIFTTICIYLFTFITVRFVKAFVGNYSDFDAEIRKVVALRLDAVMYGVFVAYLLRFHAHRVERIKGLIFIIGLTVALSLTIVFYLGVEKFSFYPENRFFRIFIDSSYFTIIPICFAMVLPAAYSFESRKKGMLIAIISQISLISYSMYLIHYALIYIPFFKRTEDAPFTNVWLNYLAYWILVISISALNYRFFENPITKLRGYLSHKE